jgi:hypothetical protein
MTGVEKQDMLSVRDVIGGFVEKQPVLDRVDAAISKIQNLHGVAESEMTEQCRKDTECAEAVLRKIVASCGQIANASKPWSSFKERGRDALPKDFQGRFDHLAQSCAEHGLCINPYGELESLLVDQGIEYTTDKKAWIHRALALIPNLQVDPSKRMWKLLAQIHGLLQINE